MRAFRWLVLSLALGLVVTDWQAGAQAPTSVITGTGGVVLYGIGDLSGSGGVGSTVRDAMKALIPFNRMLAFLNDAENFINGPNPIFERSGLSGPQALLDGEVQKGRSLLL